MVNEVFNRFWSDLEGFYGKKDLHRDFKDKAEWALRNVPTAKSVQVYDYIVFNYDFFPKLPEFRNIAAKFEDIKEAPGVDERCVYCLGSGLIKYRRKVKGLCYEGDFYAACVCSNGARFKNNPVKSIEQVYGGATEEVLRKLAERNGGKRAVSQLKEEFIKNVSLMGEKNRGFKCEA